MGDRGPEVRKLRHLAQEVSRLILAGAWGSGDPSPGLESDHGGPPGAGLKTMNLIPSGV